MHMNDSRFRSLKIDCIRKRYAYIDQRRSMAIQFNFHNGCTCDSFLFLSVFMRFKIPIFLRISVFYDFYI